MKSHFVSGYILKKFLSVFLIVSFFMAPLAPIFAQESGSEPVVSAKPTEITTEATVTSEPSNEQVDNPEGPTPDPIDPEVLDQNDKSKDNEKTKDEDKDKDKEKKDDEGSDPQMMVLRDGSEQQTALPPSTIKQLIPQSDKISGSLVYSYPIVVPPGRNNMQPDLALTYNSQAQSEEGSIVGTGWSTNIPYIERINRKGVEKLYTENYFASSLSGELVNTSGSVYKAKVDNGDYLEYALSSNVWTVKDKSGTVYKFGTNAAERQDNSGDTSKVYRWMLQEVRDLNDNYIKYTYYKDAGQIYPSTIVYTGNGSTDGVFVVTFTRESRSDAVFNYKPGFSVTTNYRISEIKTEVNSSWVKKYAIAYTTADNDKRSLLNTITETGQDESSNTLSLPATDIDYQTHVTDWTEDTNWELPTAFTNETYKDRGARIADVAGDGWQDVLISRITGYDGNGDPIYEKKYYKNTGTTWTEDTNWTIPVPFVNNQYQDMGVQLADINGDLLVDIMQYRIYNYGGNDVEEEKVWLNNGTNGWTLQTSGWDLPHAFIKDLKDYGTRMSDLNGDGLIDIFWNRISGYDGNGDPIYDRGVYMNNGSTWVSDTNWTVPLAFVNTTYVDQGVRVADINNDGLADLIKFRIYNYGGNDVEDKSVYINNGGGWTVNTNWVVPKAFRKDANDFGTRVADVNGDGLPDIVHSRHTGYSQPGDVPTYDKYVYLNDGTNWVLDTNWTVAEPFVNNQYQDQGVQLADYNADGMTDILKKRITGYDVYDNPIYSKAIHNNNGSKVDLASRITYPRGGRTDIVYKTSPNYMNGSTMLNPSMPFVLDTVYTLSNYDGLGVTSVVTNKYEGGKYYFNTAFDRKISGFNKITKTDSASNSVKNFYHQGDSTDSSNGEYSDDDSKIGKIYRTEIADSSGNIYKKVINKWENYSPDTGRDFVKLAQTIGMSYDGDSDHKDLAKTYTYDDANGNLTQQIEWGEVTGADAGTYTDTGSDKFTTDIAYASNTSPSIVGLPKQETVNDQSSNKVRESKYYYDTQAHGSVTKGNLTKEEKWKTGTTYIDYEKTYDGTYGLVATEKDPRDKTTTYSYDSYNLYPASVTNPLSQVTSYTYDYSLGKPKQVTDVNSRVFQTVYDALDRVIEEKQPDLTTPSTLVTKSTYTYTAQTIGNKIQKTDYLDASTTVDTYTYTDGFDRPIQTRKEMEDGNYATIDTVYNNIEQVYKESLPYSSSGTAKTSATTDANMLATYAYDPLLRISTLTNIIGTITNAYDQWKTSVTDLRSKVKHYYKDAYDNLVQVDEVNSGSTYSTYYEWNGNNKLTKITDALSNIRNFTYDGLGRRLTAQDLHATADGTYGTWSYTYDDTGNLTQTVDPKSQTVNYTYDDINRVLTENYTGDAGTEVTYTYDSGTDGTGRLTSVTATGANTSYVYNPHGKVKQETKTINSVGYQTDYTFDRQGNTLEITNPDSSKVKYTYNTAGQLETIQRKESTDGSFVNLVTDLDYGPHEKVTYQAFTNGVTTTNTYNASALYRMTRKLTTLSGGSKMQDLNYTYDNNGNITQIVDASNTDSSKTVAYTYDDLNRLLSAAATSVASGQSTYTHTYAYNAIGNITSGPLGTYTYSSSGYYNPHALTSIGTTDYTYDNSGNLTNDETWTHTWDYKNRITQSAKTGTTVTYAYDQNGSRVRNDNGTTNIITPSQYYSKEGSTHVKHIYVGNQLVATVRDTGSSATPYYLHTDHLGSSNVVTDSTGTLKELSDYFAYGDPRIHQTDGGFDDRKGYIGKDYSTDTELSYLEARYLSNERGQFLSQDPVFLTIGNENKIKELTKTEQLELLKNPQTLNSYMYAVGNPLRFSDPNGLWFKEFTNGQQSWGGNNGLQMEIGQATQQLTQNSPVWNFAVDHPVVSGMGLGVSIGSGIQTLGVPTSLAVMEAYDVYSNGKELVNAVKENSGISNPQVRTSGGKLILNLAGSIAGSVTPRPIRYLYSVAQSILGSSASIAQSIEGATKPSKTNDTIKSGNGTFISKPIKKQ